MVFTASPDPSGIASYSADLLPLLDATGSLSIDRFVDRPGAGRAAGSPNVFNAHDFVWKHQRAAYNLVVYQLGNARWHDYMWAYLVAYPGLVVLHDTKLHHARARLLLSQGRTDDYRAEFRYNHPDAAPGVEEYAVEGLSGSVYYFWSMLPVVLRASRLVAVHNARIAANLSEQHPQVRDGTIRMGVPATSPGPPGGGPEGGRALRRDLGIADSATVFVAFGHVTSEKRIEPILRAVAELAAKGHDIHLLLVGPADGFPALGGLVERQRLAARVHVTGYVDDRRVTDYFAAADACLCLRWPTAGETSASWLRALAAGRPTVITKLAHLADVPTLAATTWRPSHAVLEPVALSVDLLDEDAGLLAAMSKLSTDSHLRGDLARSGHAYWAREHALELMVNDYLRILREAAARETPQVSDLPAHFTDDYSALVRRIEDEMGVGRRS